MSLKLEKQKNSKIRLILRKDKGLLTWDFGFALLIALSLHLSAFFLFSIDLGSFLNLAEIPTSLVVLSDPSISMADALDEDEKPVEFPPFLVIERKKPASILRVDTTISPKVTFHSFDLSHLEFDRLNVQGASHFFLSRGNTFIKEPESLTSKKCCKAILEFKAHPQTGEIFWVHWIEPTGDTKLDHRIIENLKTARLTPSSASAQGIIEVEFHS